MNKRLLVVAGVLCVTMGLSACTTNPYTGESEAGKAGIGAGLGAALGAAGRSPSGAAPPAVARDAVRDSRCLSVRQRCRAAAAFRRG